MSKKVNITIAGRTYPLTVSDNEETTVKNSAKAIQDNIDRLKDKYKINDLQDLLAMTTLEFATKLENNKASDLSSDDKLHLNNLKALLENVN